MSPSALENDLLCDEDSLSELSEVTHTLCAREHWITVHDSPSPQLFHRPCLFMSLFFSLFLSLIFTLLFVVFFSLFFSGGCAVVGCLTCLWLAFPTRIKWVCADSVSYVSWVTLLCADMLGRTYRQIPVCVYSRSSPRHGARCANYVATSCMCVCSIRCTLVCHM